MSSTPATSAPARDSTVRQLMRPLAPFLADSAVTEVTCNRPGELWGKGPDGWARHEVPELSEDYLRALARALITYNAAKPRSIVSVQLPDGERGQIVFPPACVDGTLSLSIRKHALAVKTLEQLDEEGAFSAARDVSFRRPTAEEVAEAAKREGFGRLEACEEELLALKREARWPEFLRACVLHRRNIVVAGKTGSGKTTLARSLIEEVPRDERLITVEDVHELLLPNHPNRVHMLYGTGGDRPTVDECLASCMRQSPDRIFLAELRGDETWEYLSALNSGHPGAVTTTHANGAVATFERLATLVKQSAVGRLLELEVIRKALTARIHVVLFMASWRVREVFYDPLFASEEGF